METEGSHREDSAIENLNSRHRTVQNDHCLEVILEVDNEGTELGLQEESKHSQSLRSTSPPRASSTSSHRSIMSQDFLSRHDLGQIRQSKTKKQDKDVNVWSPFTIGTAFPLGVSMVKKRYIRGEVPDRRQVEVPLVDSLRGGLILDLPDLNIVPYLEHKLDLQHLPQDEELVSFMEDWIGQHMRHKAR